jgi:hypothetical protein
MELEKATQQLRRDLQGIASDLKWSAVELVRIAERLSLASNDPDAQALLRMCSVSAANEQRLNGYVEETQAGPVRRTGM